MAVNSLSQLVDFSSLSQVFSLSCMTKFTVTDFRTQFLPSLEDWCCS